MWNRKWDRNLIKNLAGDNPEDQPLAGWASVIYTLPNPLLVAKDVLEIHSIRYGGKECRLYPPFPLDNPGAVNGSFSAPQIPVGRANVQSTQPLPEGRPTSFIADHAVNMGGISCHALRIDHKIGLDLDSLYARLLEHFVLFTWQWWLRAPQSPFQGPLKYSFEVSADYVPCGYGLPISSWAAAMQTQTRTGLELLFSPEAWRHCVSNTAQEIPADTGPLFFVDALVSYMANNDDRCILNLAICFEILANKVRLAEGRTKPLHEIRQLLRETSLVSGPARSIVSKLFYDRDHVAHGRKPYIIGNSADISIESYLDAILDVLRAYIARTGHEGERFARMQIARR